MAEPSGFAILDKPSGCTSHDVVARARRALNTRKVGHAGTLDPMATGVLVLGVGRATRLLSYLVGADKTYLATIRLGISTNTDDAEGQLLAQNAVSTLNSAQLAASLAEFTGPIQQVPSAVSAIKIKGKRAYTRVREGEQVELPARPVTVYEFTVLSTSNAEVHDLPVLDLQVRARVSSGTYIRALARDLGVALGVGGHLSSLRRTRVAEFSVEHATELADFQARPDLLPMPQVAKRIFPEYRLTGAEVQTLRFGQRISAREERRAAAGQRWAGLGPDGDLVAILEPTTDLEQLRSVLVIPAD